MLTGMKFKSLMNAENQPKFRLRLSKKKQLMRKLLCVIELTCTVYKIIQSAINIKPSNNLLSIKIVLGVSKAIWMKKLRIFFWKKKHKKQDSRIYIYIYRSQKLIDWPLNVTAYYVWVLCCISRFKQLNKVLINMC